jgi:hydroxyacylglutathione hydrolase
LKFALTLEPDNAKLRERMERVRAAREAGRSTVPATMAEEIETNPFLRWDSAELRDNLRKRFPDLQLNPVSVFATVRQLKDQF